MQTFNLEIDGCAIEIELDEDGKFIIPDGWRGIGSALKPAWECIALARKPLSESTIARNIARWGTGAINVDGCRVEGGERPARGAHGARPDGDTATSFDMGSGYALGATSLGRFPANLCHDGSDEVLAAFPESNGSGNKNVRNRDNGNTIGDGLGKGYGYGIGGDSGSAARFYYSAKASKADRANSKHPTVKPVKLMQWLVRLITPPGGTTLDPFAGSGTTGAAAFLEGFNAVLIEREEEYQADIERRIGSLEPAAPAAPDLFACA
jgi:site-specific DNA-methyltransferase (adenine-specific)